MAGPDRHGDLDHRQCRQRLHRRRIGWTEQLIVRNTSTGHQVATIAVTQPARIAALSAGAIRSQRSVQITWPARASTATGAVQLRRHRRHRQHHLRKQSRPAPARPTTSPRLDITSAPDLVVQGLTADRGQRPRPAVRCSRCSGTTLISARRAAPIAVFRRRLDRERRHRAGGAARRGARRSRVRPASLPGRHAGPQPHRHPARQPRRHRRAHGHRHRQPRPINYQAPILVEVGNATNNNAQSITDHLGRARPCRPHRLRPRGARHRHGRHARSRSPTPSPTPAWPPRMRRAGPTRSCSALTPSSAMPTTSCSAASSIPGHWPRAPPTPRTQSVVLPSQFNGTGYIAVLTDPAGAVTEPNRGQRIHHARPRPDRHHRRCIPTSPPRRSRRPPPRNDGDHITVAWRVANLGDAATAPAGGWTDQIYLSATDSVTSGSILLGTLPHSARASRSAAPTPPAPPWRCPAASPAPITSSSSPTPMAAPTRPAARRTTPARRPARSADRRPAFSRSRGHRGQHPRRLGARRAHHRHLHRAEYRPGHRPRPLGRPARAAVPGRAFASSVSLATVQRSFDLAVGASYTVTATVTLPSLPDGVAEIGVTTDAGGAVNQGGRTGNDTLDSAAFTTTHPDLVPIQVQSPDHDRLGPDADRHLDHVQHRHRPGRARLDRDGHPGAGRRLHGDRHDRPDHAARRRRHHRAPHRLRAADFAQRRVFGDRQRSTPATCGGRDRVRRDQQQRQPTRWPWRSRPMPILRSATSPPPPSPWPIPPRSPWAGRSPMSAPAPASPMAPGPTRSCVSASGVLGASRQHRDRPALVHSGGLALGASYSNEPDDHAPARVQRSLHASSFSDQRRRQRCSRTAFDRQ